jgi:hypothetical protein
MGWLITSAVISVTLFLPLGFSAVYRMSDPGIWLLVGPFRFRVYPGKKKENKSQKSVSDNKENNETKGGSYRDFQPVVRTIVDFLGEFCQKIRVKRLELKVVLAGGDPSDLAVNYGRAWAALGNLIPQLERLLVIKKRNLEVECDFIAEETLIYARIDATISVMKTMHLLSKHGIKILKNLLELKKLRKGGAQV